MFLKHGLSTDWLGWESEKNYIYCNMLKFGVVSSTLIKP